MQDYICSQGHSEGVYVIRRRGVPVSRCKRCQRDGIERSRLTKGSERAHREQMVGSEPERFDSKVRVAGDCWNWQGATNNNGYGIVTLAGRNVLAHRVSYRRHHGAIALDLEIDHLCRNRRCVNPAHLEAVAHDENMRRINK